MEDTQHTSFFKGGFIAIHHDEILDVGVHAYAQYVDKDTRIIDGSNHIAVPSFIEVSPNIPKHCRQGARELYEIFMRYMQNGTLTMYYDKSIQKNLLQDYHYEIVQNVTCQKMPILYALKQIKQSTSFDETVCISCADDAISLQNQMMAAQLLAMKEDIDAYHLLKALTTSPATYLNLQRYAKLKEGYIANILLLSTSDIHSFFYSLDQNRIAHIIHKGVRIFPNLLI